jgi:hypothetical protein
MITGDQQRLIFGAELDGDDPIGDGYLDDPATDLALPDTTDDPGGLVDPDFDPIEHSGRAGSVTNYRLAGMGPTFGHDDFYPLYGPAVVVGCDLGSHFPTRIKG